MNRTHLYHYILLFFLPIIWLLPAVTKAAEQFNVNIATSSTPSKINTRWYPYPRSMQLRSGWTVAKSNEKSVVVMPSMLDFDILYVHPCLARQLDTYPRIGLSILVPFALQKTPQLRFPNIWGILAYIELYQSNPGLSTWGNRISIGAIKGGTLVQAQHPPGYSFLATKEIIYHWLCAPSWQCNLGIGLLVNGWTKNKQSRPEANKANDQLDTTQQTLNDAENQFVRLRFAPMATIGIRYIAHTASLLKLRHNPIHSRKLKSSRIDCSIACSGRRLPSVQKYYLIFRGVSLFSYTINAHNALLCAMELGYNWYKKALFANMLSAGGVEVIPWIGYELRYGYYLLQFQLGCEITDSKKLAIQTSQTSNEDTLSNVFKSRGSFSVHLQYMLTESLFVGISARAREIPALRLGLSW
ncbi:hypothetical protein [Cardinium endosymbiont of Nabis limbatus]|uniref:hypothetical protein n=1 Tax=Cardinium endosymbiont of Nabis limbatus TaxID=3066217 RepID=UPI003AF3F59C